MIKLLFTRCATSNASRHFKSPLAMGRDAFKPKHASSVSISGVIDTGVNSNMINQFCSYMESFHKNEFHTYRIKNVPRHILYFLSIFFFLTDSANNRFSLVLNMLACKLCSQLFIMSGNRINNCLMLIQQLWVAFFLL